jgi:phospholipid/cholesterol/gamma-HCH transport system substrate-binding protein
MQTPITKFERATGVFITVVFALITLAILGAGHRTNIIDFFREGFILYAVAEEGHGAAVGSPVKVRGVEVGSVTRVELNNTPEHPDKPVRLTIRIQPQAAQFLKDRTVAVIIEPPLGSGMPPFGTAAVELRTAGGQALARRATIMAEGEESMVQTMAKMSRDVSAMRDQLLSSVSEMGSTFANMRRLTDSMVDGKGLAGRMLTDAQLASDLESTLRDARSATGDARRLMNDMGKATAQLPAVMSDARATTKDAQQMMAKLSASLESMPRLIASTERTLALTEDLMHSLRSTAGYAPELVRKVDVSLDETNRLVEAAQRNFILRSTLPDRVGVRTESVVRPPVVLPRGAPATAPAPAPAHSAEPGSP